MLLTLKYENDYERMIEILIILGCFTNSCSDAQEFFKAILLNCFRFLQEEINIQDRVNFSSVLFTLF